MQLKKIKKGMFVSSAPFIVVPAFTPASLSPGAWYEVRQGGLFQSNAGTTAATANNDPIGFMPDLSGNSRTQKSPADDTSRPVLQGVGSFPYFDCNGSSSVLFSTVAMSSYASTSGFTWAVVFRSNGNATNSRLLAEGSSAGGNPIMTPLQAQTGTASSSGAFYRNDSGASVGASSPTSGNTPSNADVFNGSDHVFIYTDDGTSLSSTSNIATYLDGVAGATLTFTRNGTAITVDRFSIGALVRNFPTTPIGNFWAGRVYGGVFLNRVITSTERANLTTYLGTLAGLTL